MKFTYYCEPGRFLSPRQHFVFIGDWIRPDGYIILQHGNISYLENRKIERQGFIRIFEDSGSDYTYIETIVNRSDVQRYRDMRKRKVGILTRKSYNLYAGRIWVYGRVVK